MTLSGYELAWLLMAAASFGAIIAIWIIRFAVAPFESEAKMQQFILVRDCAPMSLLALLMIEPHMTLVLRFIWLALLALQIVVTFFGRKRVRPSA